MDVLHSTTGKVVTMSVNIVSFYSLKPESADRPFGFYADEEATMLIMETLIAAYDAVNSKRDKTDADWKEWRNLKDITNKLMLSFIKYTRDTERINEFADNLDEPIKVSLVKDSPFTV
jgi:hypothetical protein